MTTQEIMQEIITLIDELDQPDEESVPTKEPSLTEMDNVLTAIYELCEAALD